MTRRVIRALSILPGLYLGAIVAGVARPVVAADHPIAGDAIDLRDLGGKRIVSFEADADSAIDVATLPDPRRNGSSVEIIGAGVGLATTGAITLAPGAWEGLGNPPGSRGYKYVDKDSTVGVKTLVLQSGRNGGSLSLRGGGPNWPLTLTQRQDSIQVKVTVGGEVYCALFTDDDLSVNQPGQIVGEAAAPPADCGPPTCGNGRLEPGEACDDGNLVAGDCCGYSCQVERDGNACSDSFCDDSGMCAAGVCRRSNESCDEVNLLQRQSKNRLETTFENGVARGILGRIRVYGDDTVGRGRDFLQRFGDLFRAYDANLAFRVREVEAGEAESILFYQTYRDLPVFGSELRVSISAGHVLSVVGRTLGPVIVDTTPLLSATDAELVARAEARGNNLPLTGPIVLTIIDRSLLGAARLDARLAWRVPLTDASASDVFVDAHSGQVLAKLPSSLEHGGAKDGIDFEIEDAEEEANANDDSCYDLSNDPQVADENGLLPAYEFDADAFLTWGLLYPHTYVWFHQSFGRHSYDNDGSEMEIFIHSDAPTSWSNRCEQISFATGQVDFEVLTHEFTHGIISETSELEYECEPGALNESYADVMAGLADHDMFAAGDWRLFENQTNGAGAFRDIMTPAFYCQPDRLTNPSPKSPVDNDGDGDFDEDLANGIDDDSDGMIDEDPLECQPIVVACPEDPDLDNDHGGVHNNSGVANHTAFFMVDGGNNGAGIVVHDMGLPKTRQLKYRAMRKLTSGAGFQEARNFELGTAMEWAGIGKNGFTVDDVCTVRNAWAAVGVGLNDFDCNGVPDGYLDNDLDGVPNHLDNCPDDANQSQSNIDSIYEPGLAKFGDRCDPDMDGDGIPNVDDPCPKKFSMFGCNDFDGDGVADSIDNCFATWNPRQSDSNADGEGDACDPDTDEDGTPNNNDNCPFIVNADQADSDMDGYGDACDQCPNDEDKIVAFTPYSGDLGFGLGGIPYQPDSDGDGIPDACDPSLKVDGETVDFLDLGVGTGTGSSMEIDAGTVANRHLRTQIEICSGPCPDGFDPHYGVQLKLNDLDPRIRTWISDDRGRSVTRGAAKRLNRTLRFQPKGGRKYYLNFFLRPEFDQPRAAFNLKVKKWRAPLRRVVTLDER